MIFFIIWIACGLISAMIASGNGSSGCVFFILGILLGPIGIIIALLSSGQKCPECGKKISNDAKTCPYCRTKFDDEKSSENTNSESNNSNPKPNSKSNDYLKYIK